MSSKKTLDLMNQALDELTEEIERNPDPLAFPLKSARVDYLPAELVRPDPIQVRRVLPESIHHAFHSSRLTPVQALQELVRSAQLAARQNGRPFTSVIDLLADLSVEVNEQAQPLKYTPEEMLVRDLVTLAATIRDDGQVNPLTVVDVTQGVTRLFRIETGERRYWASWLLREFLPGYTGDGTISCVIIKSTQASVFRQARENTARAGLSAIAMARQAALLLMAAHDIPRPDKPVDNDFYRQALDLDLRDRREHTDDILIAMGGITKGRLHQYKTLLRLDDEAIEIADRFDVDEYRLRFVLQLPVDAQGEMVKQIVQFGLSAKQVKDMVEQSGDELPETIDLTPSKQEKQLARLTRNIGDYSAEAFARTLIAQEKDPRIAIVRLQALKALIEATEQYLSA